MQHSPGILWIIWPSFDHPGEMGDFKWSEDKEAELVELWQQHANLYNLDLASYHNKHSKAKSLQEIRTQLGCSGRYAGVSLFLSS